MCVSVCSTLHGHNATTVPPLDIRHSARGCVRTWPYSLSILCIRIIYIYNTYVCVHV